MIPRDAPGPHTRSLFGENLLSILHEASDATTALSVQHRRVNSSLSLDSRTRLAHQQLTFSADDGMNIVSFSSSAEGRHVAPHVRTRAGPRISHGPFADLRFRICVATLPSTNERTNERGNEPIRPWWEVGEAARHVIFEASNRVNIYTHPRAA